MYNTEDKSKIFSLYQLKKDGYFHRVREFESLDHLIRYIAEREITESERRLRGSYAWTRYKNGSVLQDINVTGKDVKVIESIIGDQVERIFAVRNFMILDGTGRSIDPRLFIEKIKLEMKDLVKEGRAGRCSIRELPPHIRFRRDPVPGTGYGPLRIRLRNIKHWFRRVRQDSIPEYSEYVRKKGKVPDPWTEDRFEPQYKSWKHQSKKRHQWE